MLRTTFSVPHIGQDGHLRLFGSSRRCGECSGVEGEGVYHGYSHKGAYRIYGMTMGYEGARLVSVDR